MSHSSGSSEYAPGNRERMLANFVATTIIGSFRIMLSIFSTIFRFLTSIA
ncbi:MAG: hypothetical protein ABEJ95_00355 [Candidatus Nanohalobium sp.]